MLSGNNEFYTYKEDVVFFKELAVQLSLRRPWLQVLPTWIVCLPFVDLAINDELEEYDENNQDTSEGEYNDFSSEDDSGQAVAPANRTFDNAKTTSCRDAIAEWNWRQMQASLTIVCLQPQHDVSGRCTHCLRSVPNSKESP